MIYWRAACTSPTSIENFPHKNSLHFVKTIATGATPTGSSPGCRRGTTAGTGRSGSRTTGRSSRPGGRGSPGRRRSSHGSPRTRASRWWSGPRRWTCSPATREPGRWRASRRRSPIRSRSCGSPRWGGWASPTRVGWPCCSVRCSRIRSVRCGPRRPRAWPARPPGG